MKYSFVKIHFPNISLVIYDRYQKDLTGLNSIGFLGKNEVLGLSSDTGSIEFISEPKNGFCSLRLCETQQYFVTLLNSAAEHPEKYSINLKKELEATQISKGMYSFKVINYLGKTDFEILYDRNIIHSIKLEIISKKIDYEDDYIKLTEDIAEKCSALLLDYSSPTNLSFKDNNESAKTPLEKFIFIRTFCNNDNIESFFHSIKSNPDSLLVSEDELKPFGTASVSRKFFSNPFANSRNWIKTDNYSYLPEYITATRKYDSLDTHANRFLKFAFNSFIEVCDEVIKFLGDKNLTYKDEAKYIKENLELYLTDSFFDDVQDLTSMPVNNQVLQKREGYAQIFNAFNMLDIAKQLDWEGEKQVYEGQARNIALLYEYWLVFKIMEILQNIGAEIQFDISDEDNKNRMFTKENGLLISLREGKTSYYSALIKDKKLKINFYYNRTFGQKDFVGTDYQGSYSRDFRPDYTLSIYPDSYTEEQAIKLGEVSFIHFDAKYRVTDITSLFGKESKEIIDEKRQNASSKTKTDEELKNEYFAEQKKAETINTYNRGDLLKMHTYNDAIRKTIGSYVLYPGKTNEENNFSVYDELLPGVGAFAIRPGDKDDSSAEALKKFISDIIEFKSNQSTRQYRKDYFENMVIQSPSENNATKVKEASKVEYQMIGFIRNEYLSFLQESGHIPTSLDDFKSNKSFEFYFYFYAIKNGKVYTIHKETNKAKYLRVTTTDVKDCKVEFGYRFQHLEPWEAEVESIELVSKKSLKEKLNGLYGKDAFVPETGFNADFYYLAKAKVTRYSETGMTDINAEENDDISVYSPKIIPRQF